MVRCLLLCGLLLATAPGRTLALAQDPPAGSVAAQLLDKATEAYNNRNWQEVADAYDLLTKENPYNGAFFYRLATAHYQLKNYDASIRAYQESARLGYQRGGSLYNMGCCYALIGQQKEAVNAIVMAIENGLRNREQLLRTDSDLDSIRGRRDFQEQVLPTVDSSADRVDGWRADLDYLTERMEKTHYDLYRSVSRDEWHDGINGLKANVANMKDYEIIVELMKLVTLIGDGHTAVRIPRDGRFLFHGLPVRFYIFKDGVFVRSALREYEGLVGARLLRIGNVSIEEALRRTATLTQRDNGQQVKWIAPHRLSLVEVLDGLDVVDGLGPVELTVAKDGTEDVVSVTPVEATRELIRNLDDNAVMMNAVSDQPLPLYLKDPSNHYWFEYLESEKTVYFQFSAVRDNEQGETIEQFAAHLFDFVNGNEVESLVIDVRHNHGGNNFLIKPIIDGVIKADKINQRGRLFVITGRETFSACQNFCNRLDRETEAMFVGEPTGSARNFVGEGNPIQLPWSGLVVNGSSRYWQDGLSDDFRQWLAPELVAELTSEDFKNNHDPAMEVIRAYRANRNVPRGSSTGM
jgi:tetratricopeptide (TPR) repeat protein